MELDVLKVWPGWSAVRLIGEGSFGKVYEIVRNNFGIEEHSALKVVSIPSSQAELQSLRNEGMDDASATEYYRGLVDEFVQEIALMLKLKGNANIVGYEDYAVIKHENSVGWDILIRMELLTDLPSYIRQHALTPNDILKISMDVCGALEVCHEQKIIHRDIKPDNIFISSNGDYKLGDFGVARTIEKTISGLSKKGTYTYMAPEVYKGEAYGSNVDLYSLGIVMYKLLNNNREPFLPPHPQLIKYNDKNNALIRRMSGEQIVSPANADSPLADVILKACAFRSVDRYQTPTQMKDDLKRAMNGLEPQNAPVLLSEQIEASNTKSSSSASQNVDQTPPQVENSLKDKPIAQREEIPQGKPPIETQPTPEAKPITGNPPVPAVKPNVYVFGNQSGMPAQPVRTYQQNLPNVAASQNDVQLQNKRTLVNALGWVGFGFTFIVALMILPYTVVQTIGIAVTQILFSAKKESKASAIIMMICSICSLAFLNIAASAIYLSICGRTEKR